MSFKFDDFKHPANQTKIQAIVLDKMNLDLTTNYHELSTRQQKKFQKIQNEYLNTVPFKNNNWEETLTDDFNEVANDFMNGKKNYLHMVDNTILDKEMVYRDDAEREYHENELKEGFDRFLKSHQKKKEIENSSEILV
jgi:hypothetical protein